MSWTRPPTMLRAILPIKRKRNVWTAASTRLSQRTSMMLSWLSLLDDGKRFDDGVMSLNLKIFYGGAPAMLLQKA
jgi:hypothetical protein